MHTHTTILTWLGLSLRPGESKILSAVTIFSSGFGKSGPITATYTYTIVYCTCADSKTHRWFLDIESVGNVFIGRY